MAEEAAPTHDDDAASADTPMQRTARAADLGADLDPAAAHLDVVERVCLADVKTRKWATAGAPWMSGARTRAEVVP